MERRLAGNYYLGRESGEREQVQKGLRHQKTSRP
jgi:hypothetical protein